MKPWLYFVMGLGALRANVFSESAPLSVMLSVTDRCNSKCWYCDIPLRRQKEMATGDVLHLIDEMSAAGVRKLSFWGGEPLLRDDIGILISRAKERMMHVNIDSNGYLIPEKFKEIRNLNFLILSFDGEKELHDKNREPGSYDKFFRAVEFIGGRIPIWTLTVLTKHNIHSIDFIVRKARQYGFKTLFQVPYHPFRLGSSDDLMARPEEYAKAFGHLLRLKKERASIISSTRYLNAVAQWNLFPQTTSESRPLTFPACWAGRLFCNIDTNGDMYPCSPMIGSYERPPNVLKDGFAECFRKLKRPNCQSCLSGCSLEANFVFSFDWKSIAEWMKVL
ncbi:MAG: radical SAM protein [Candidatus Omnitrophota bacterium]